MVITIVHCIPQMIDDSNNDNRDDSLSKNYHHWWLYQYSQWILIITIPIIVVNTQGTMNNHVVFKTMIYWWIKYVSNEWIKYQQSTEWTNHVLLVMLIVIMNQQLLIIVITISHYHTVDPLNCKVVIASTDFDTSQESPRIIHQNSTEKQ